MNVWFRSQLVLIPVCLLSAGVAAVVDEYKSGIVWKEPRVVTPGEAGSPPSDAIVLFDGTDLSQWEGGKWMLVDGVAIPAEADVRTREGFGDCQLHLEFATPAEVSGEGQGRGNSGVYLMDRYEVQILDSFENATYFDGQCAAIYKQSPPMVNACRKPGEWQTYDILFRAPRFDAEGRVTQRAAVTLLHNGVAAHHHFELPGATFYEKAPEYQAHPEKAPVRLQFHGNPVRFRNIWIRPLAAAQPEQPQ